MSEENPSGARKKECGLSSKAEEDVSEQGKRQCVTPNKVEVHGAFGEIPASPPKFVSFEELMKAANNVTNMVLVREIAVNKDFKLGQYVEPPNSIEENIKNVVHRAFWDVLKNELAEDPPNYTQAMVLISEIKQGLLELLLPQHTKIHQQISEVLDIDIIKQQAEKGILDFQQYAQYVISIMGKMCAPIRDEKIASLSKTTDVVEIFKGILETLDLMKLDMANFTINVMRPQIVANSVEYEKKKFSDFLKLDPDGLMWTKQWLKQHLAAGDQYPDKIKKIKAVINDAYLDLLEWNNSYLPETLVVDRPRIADLGTEHDKLTLTASILLITYALSGPDLCSIDEFKQKLKKDTLMLLKDTEIQNPEVLKSTLEMIAEKLKHNILAAVDQFGVGGSQINTGILGFQLSELNDKNHKVRNLLRLRLREFMLDTITSQTAERMKIPPGFSSLQPEVTQLAGTFLRLISHNRAVYEEFYVSILDECLN